MDVEMMKDRPSAEDGADIEADLYETEDVEYIVYGPPPPPKERRKPKKKEEREYHDGQWTVKWIQGIYKREATEAADRRKENVGDWVGVAIHERVMRERQPRNRGEIIEPGKKKAGKPQTVALIDGLLSSPLSPEGFSRVLETLGKAMDLAERIAAARTGRHQGKVFDDQLKAIKRGWDMVMIAKPVPLMLPRPDDNRHDDGPTVSYDGPTAATEDTARVSGDRGDVEGDPVDDRGGLRTGEDDHE